MYSEVLPRCNAVIHQTKQLCDDYKLYIANEEVKKRRKLSPWRSVWLLEHQSLPGKAAQIQLERSYKCNSGWKEAFNKSDSTHITPTQLIGSILNPQEKPCDCRSISHCQLAGWSPYQVYWSAWGKIPTLSLCVCVRETPWEESTDPIRHRKAREKLNSIFNLLPVHDNNHSTRVCTKWAAASRWMESLRSTR